MIARANRARMDTLSGHEKKKYLNIIDLYISHIDEYALRASM